MLESASTVDAATLLELTLTTDGDADRLTPLSRCAARLEDTGNQFAKTETIGDTAGS